jgi:poly [ADP-ribose] polymerase
MVSKSANYCCTNPGNTTGLLLLSEVALGNTHELTRAKFVTELPAGKHSVKGVGKTTPNPNGFKQLPNGVLVPMGTPVTDDKLRSDLLYNEYIVYDIAQVSIQYMLKMNFKYKKH